MIESEQRRVFWKYWTQFLFVCFSNRVQSNRLNWYSISYFDISRLLIFCSTSVYNLWLVHVEKRCNELSAISNSLRHFSSPFPCSVTLHLCCYFHLENHIQLKEVLFCLEDLTPFSYMPSVGWQTVHQSVSGLHQLNVFLVSQLFHLEYFPSASSCNLSKTVWSDT